MQVEDIHTRVALLEQAMQNIKSELHNISSNLMKLVWVVVSAVVIGVVNLWVRFGAHIPG